MKPSKVVLTAMILMFFGTVFAKSVLLEFKVEGQCGDCKERIEKALDRPGINYAQWNVETKVLTVRFNDNKFSESDIHKIISDLGYSTSKLKASKTAEQKLPKCCQPGGMDHK